MEFTVSRETLLPALGKVIGVVERRQTMPILSNLHLVANDDRVMLTATDLEVEVKTSFPVELKQSGEVTIPAKKLVDICRSLGEGTEIHFQMSDERCTVKAERSRFTLGLLPASEFPLMDTVQDGFQLSITESVFKRLLDKTAFAMAQQDVRYYLNGLLLEFRESTLTAVATDGHRLAKFQSSVDVGISELRQIIVPSKTISELRRQLNYSDDVITMSLGEKSIHIVMGNLTMTSKLVDGRYPEYERVIPHTLSRQASLKKDELKRALSRTAILSNEKYRGVRLTFDQGMLRLLAQNPSQEEAEEEIELDYQDDSISIGFNVSYLTDVLGVIDGKEVYIQFQDANSSSVWHGKDADDESYVVMPMRI
ncbi:DNA polymerase III subunit beta [Chromatium okenii]|jgi:DNA polymerase-3 subunit beta|uniref:Beta sliding clamp n=1 Tax=Chromatium okenii TaxID=61644 RepID=A0A2S7XQJ5_9GAMM|nr:DNA polymerase III subunit beta [Chromatium okenii]PQJ95936.1 DNA polymerase III subunit beta [Chromatium okenii]